MSNYFDTKTWVKRYFRLPASDKSIDETNNSLEFLWVWSIFESKYLVDSNISRKSFNEQLVNIAKCYPIDKIELETTYLFLRKRYFHNERFTKYYHNLNLSNKWDKKIKSILMQASPVNEDKLIAILIILYKFRCNLFHGNKDPLLWKNFDLVFYYLNKFLANFLDVRWNK